MKRYKAELTFESEDNDVLDIIRALRKKEADTEICLEALIKSAGSWRDVFLGQVIRMEAEEL